MPEINNKELIGSSYDKKIIFHGNAIKLWRMAWYVGILSTLVCLCFEVIFAYLNLTDYSIPKFYYVLITYGFFCGILAIPFFWLPYAILDSNGIKIYTGIPFLREFILLKWKDLDTVELTERKVEIYVSTILSRQFSKEPTNVLVLKLVDEFSEDRLLDIKKYSSGKMFFSQSFDVPKSNNEIWLTLSPKEGFKQLLHAILKNLPTNDEIVEQSNNDIAFFKIYDFAIFTLGIVGIIFLFSKF